MEEEILRGLVELQVNDNGALTEIANFVERAKAEFARLADVPSAAIGPNLNGPLGPNMGDIEFQIRKMKELSNEYRQVAESQARNSRTAPGAEYQEVTRFLSVLDQVDRKYLEIAAHRREAEGNGRYRAVNQGEIKAQTDEALLRQMVAKGGNEAEVRKFLGLPAVNADGDEEGKRYKPRGSGQLDDLARTALPDADSLGFNELKQRVAIATEAYAKASDALEKDYKTKGQAEQAEQRYLQALRGLTTASRALQTSIDKEAAAHAAEAEAQALKDDPRQRLFGLSNEEFLKDQNVDTSKSAGRIKLEEALKENEAATAALEGKRREVTSQVEFNKLLDAKKALALKELQLKEQLVVLTQKETIEARGDGGFLGGLFGRNKEDDGFGQGSAYQAGVTLKYFALYTAFATAQQALVKIREDTERYTLAINSLAIATNTSYDAAEKLAEKYASIGEQVGQGPIATTEAMAKYAQSYGGTEDSARIGARVGGIINTLEPEQRRDNTQQDLIALAKAYGIGPGGSEDLLNQMLAVARQYGYQTPGEILPGVAAVGDIGKESGYSPAQLAALIASVMQQTGVGSDAAAGDIKRFLGSQNDPGLTQLFDRFGINQDQTLRQKLEEVSQRIGGRDPEEQTRLLAAASNPRIAAALFAAIRGIPTADKAADAASDSTGLAAEAAAKKLATFSGELQKLNVDLEQLFLALADTGAFDVLVLGLRTIRSVVDLLGQTIGVFNQMPTVLKEIIGLVTILAAANKASAVLTGGKALAETGILGKLSPNGQSVFGGAAKDAAVQRQLALAMGEQTAATTAATAASTTLGGRLLGVGTGLRAAAVGVAGLAASLLPLVALAAGATVVSDAFALKDQQTNAGNEAVGGYHDLQAAEASGDPEKILAAQKRLQGAKSEINKGNDGFTAWLMNTLVPGLKDARQGTVDKVDGLIAEAQKQIDAIKEFEDKVNAASPSSAFFGKNYNNITRGVQLIKAKGLRADKVTQIIDDLLRQSPDVVQSAIQPGEGSQGLPDLIDYETSRISASTNSVEASGQLGALAKSLRDARTRLVTRLIGEQRELAQAKAAGADTGALEGTVASTESLLAALDGNLDSVNKTFVQSVVQITKKKLEILKRNYTGPDSDAKIKATLREAMTAAVQSGDVDSLVELMNGADAAFNAEFERLLRVKQVALQIMRSSLRDAISKAQTALDNAPEGAAGAIPEYYAERNLRNQQSKLAPLDAKQQELDKQVKTAQDALKLSDPQGTDTKKPGDDLAIARTLASAVSGDGLSQAKAQLEAAKIKLGQQVVGTAEYWNTVKEVSDAERALAQAKFSSSQAEAASSVEAGNPLAAAKQAVEAAKAQVAFAVDPTEYWNSVKALNEAKYNLSRTELQVALAQKAAAEIPGDAASAAKIALDAAKAQMAQTHDPVEYWNALKALNQAQYDLAKIELQNASNRALLSIDITDPVAQARAKVREAERLLAFDKQRGAGDDVLLQDQVALRQARSDAAGTAWSQEFQDQRTNYDLQRTSLSAYLQYLRSQHDYLSAVRNKTRQQVDELNQVDQALKGLTEGLQGQWNLGDIKVPTAYEMRRQLAGGAPPTTSYVQINFTAGTKEDFQGVLERYVGTAVMQTVATAPAKVV